MMSIPYVIPDMAMLLSSAERIGMPRFEQFLLLHFMTCSDAVIVSCNPTTVLGWVVYFLHKNLPHTIQTCISGLYIFIVSIYSKTTFILYIPIGYRNYGFGLFKSGIKGISISYFTKIPLIS